MESEEDHVAATRGLSVGEAFLKALALYCAAHARDIENHHQRAIDSAVEAVAAADRSGAPDAELGVPEE